MGRNDEDFFQCFWNAKNGKIIIEVVWYYRSYRLFLYSKKSMDQERNEFFIQEAYFNFEFVSEGPNGKVKKIVQFCLEESDGILFFNLAFGDWNEKKRKIDFAARTNNRDTLKILATVGAMTMVVTNRFPDIFVYAKGSTPARTRLYQMSIVAHLQEIESLFYVFGGRNNEWQPFIKGVNYESFLIRRR